MNVDRKKAEALADRLHAAAPNKYLPPVIRFAVYDAEVFLRALASDDAQDAAPAPCGAEPVAWRREWDCDRSDLGAFVYSEEKPDSDYWQPLYAHPQPSAPASAEPRVFNVPRPWHWRDDCPPLPEPDFVLPRMAYPCMESMPECAYYTADQMRAYVLADRAARTVTNELEALRALYDEYLRLNGCFPLPHNKGYAAMSNARAALMGGAK
jgi:hypothetical protein